jgi:hypothetical protein
MITKEEAFDKGYLQKKKVFLKPISKSGGMVTNPIHVAYFQVEGASNWFQLPKNERGAFVNPFKDEEEKAYFEQVLDVDLGVHKKKDNFWHTFFVKVKKDYSLMHNGYEFDLADPLDNLRYRVAKLQGFIAPDWESKHNQGDFRFALVEEGYEEQKELSDTNKITEAYMLFGEMRNSVTKMSDVLGVYFMEKHEMKLVPTNADKDFLQKELGKIVENETDLFLKIVRDPQSKIKNLIHRSIRGGAITKEARNKYGIPGEGTSYTYQELVPYLVEAEETKSDLYLKLVAQVKMNKE